MNSEFQRIDLAGEIPAMVGGGAGADTHYAIGAFFCVSRLLCGMAPLLLIGR
jgi:hypothetical protein